MHTYHVDQDVPDLPYRPAVEMLPDNLDTIEFSAEDDAKIHQAAVRSKALQEALINGNGDGFLTRRALQKLGLTRWEHRGEVML